MISNLSKSLIPNIEQIRVANPAQVKLFFDQNRNLECSLCIISDRDMSRAQYHDTDIAIPQQLDTNLNKTLFSDLSSFAAEWHKSTGNNVFFVRRSADDAYSSTFDHIAKNPKNNFDDPFILTKSEPMTTLYLKNIFEHCDKVFGMQSA